MLISGRSEKCIHTTLQLEIIIVFLFYFLRLNFIKLQLMLDLFLVIHEALVKILMLSLRIFFKRIYVLFIYLNLKIQITFDVLTIIL